MKTKTPTADFFADAEGDFSPFAGAPRHFPKQAAHVTLESVVIFAHAANALEGRVVETQDHGVVLKSDPTQWVTYRFEAKLKVTNIATAEATIEATLPFVKR